MKQVIKEYSILTLASIILIVGVYVFKFPNNFSFGGVTGISVILGKALPFSASTFTFIINIALLLIGFIFLGKGFGIKTVYVSLLTSFGFSFCDHFFPMTKPLTNQPVLELIFAIVLPAVSAAMLFNVDASGGGTDIIAMILKKYTQVNIGTALFLVDSLITAIAFFMFGPETGLFSVCGLLAKSLVIDTVIENINLCKYFTIVCDDAAPICNFIHTQLHRSATIFRAEGSYVHSEKTIILTVMKRRQAVLLRNYVKKQQPGAFIMITNSSEIIGKGFRGLN
ncbi:YitT family protein [Paludicola sp. MB14-C6]|nr:YitT family protein [Paludicola sp. MB14-C6]WMJ24467.1 YitT family protein [Paludicola sp. MB14-C6]